MKQEWIKYICDPVDKTSLNIDKIFEKKGQYIIFGTLKSKSGNIYNIREGIPILLNRHTQSVRTVESFAYEWKTFDFDYGKKSWLQDVVRPVLGSIKYFKSKTIIDCGAGSGRQTLWMAQAGAKFVFSIELSDSAMTMVKEVTNKFRDKVFVIQADIEHLPINRKSIEVDLAYCVNVIQHTKNPKKTTLEISKLLNQDSGFIFNIYLEKGRKNFLTILNFIRNITKFIPHSILRYISYFIAYFCYIFSFLPFIGSWFKKSLPTRYGFKETWLSVYDILGSHEYQKFYTENELGLILKKANLKIIKRSKYAMLLKMR